MKAQAAGGVTTGKVVAIGLLFITSGLIALLGIGFCVYSILHQVEFTVMQNQIPGAVFGAVIAFLGVRYFLAVRRLRKDVYRSTSRFSWDHFKSH